MLNFIAVHLFILWSPYFPIWSKRTRARIRLRVRRKNHNYILFLGLESAPGQAPALWRTLVIIVVSHGRVCAYKYQRSSVEKRRFAVTFCCIVLYTLLLYLISPYNMSAEDFQLYRYDPSVGAAVFFVIFFVLVSGLHTYQMIPTKTWFFIPFVIGGHSKLTRTAAIPCIKANYHASGMGWIYRSTFIAPPVTDNN